MHLGRCQRWIHRPTSHRPRRTHCHIVPVEPCRPSRCTHRESVSVLFEFQNLSLIEIITTVCQSFTLRSCTTHRSFTTLPSSTPSMLHRLSSRKKKKIKSKIMLMRNFYNYSASRLCMRHQSWSFKTFSQFIPPQTHSSFEFFPKQGPSRSRRSPRAGRSPRTDCSRRPPAIG